MNQDDPPQGNRMELFIFIAPVVMGVGLWLILRQKPPDHDDGG
jgi:hypothetical protein